MFFPLFGSVDSGFTVTGFDRNLEGLSFHQKCLPVFSRLSTESGWASLFQAKASLDKPQRGEDASYQRVVTAVFTKRWMRSFHLSLFEVGQGARGFLVYLN